MISRKLVTIGDGGCGKTSLLMVFKDNYFPKDYVPTVFETYATAIEVNDMKVNLSLWDTAGQEDYDRLRTLSYPGADVMLMCFSIDSQSSFQNISQKWLPEIQHYCHPKMPIILVGTKTDLRRDPKTLEMLKDTNQKLITMLEGETMATRLKLLTYMECSAKNNEGIKKLFAEATKATLQEKNRKTKFCELL